MNGRIENDFKIFSQIENGLDNYPDYVISWYYYLKANDQSAMSCRDFMNKLTKFLECLNKDIKNIKLSDLNENVITMYFLNTKTKKDGTETSISYRQCIWSCLSNFFKFLYKRKLINENYFELSGIERPKGNDLKEINKKRILLNKDDFQKILNTIDTGVGSNKAKGYQKSFRNRDKSIFLIFMTTGIRKTALEEINIEDIDFENHTLDIIDKGHKLFTYYLTDEVIDTLNKWLIDRYFILGEKKDGALFISKEGKRMCGNSIAKLVDKYSYAALGYHISPHKLRSGFASILYEEKHDLEYVRRVIGHSNISTTQRYVVTNNTENIDAANIISDFLREVS